MDLSHSVLVDLMLEAFNFTLAEQLVVPTVTSNSVQFEIRVNSFVGKK